MKNLTRVLVLALVFSMIISTVAFGATFTDVEEGTPVAEATDVLAALGILNGDGDGTFGPDRVITRAEVVAVANRLQGLSDAAKGAAGTTIYTDVAADAWYAGDVNLATQMGIISGDGNGLFRPNDSVKYEEAVKIMVAACGYQNNYVLAKGGWPTGYLVIASEAGITKGIGAGAGQDAYRGIVARLAYNSFDAPMMVSDGYNSDGTYQYKAKDDKQLGYDKLGIYKFDAVVAQTSLTDASLDVDEVKVNVSDAYKIYDADFWTTNPISGAVTGKTNVKIETGATDVADYLGYTVTLFVKENDMGAYEAVAMTIPAKLNSTVKLEDATLITSGTIADAQNDYIKYVDDDNDIEEEYNLSYTIASTQEPVALYVNGVADTSPTLAEINAGGVVELLDNNDDGLYDYIFVTRYVTDVVTDVYAGNTKIALENANIDLTDAIKGKKGYAYTITLDGEAIDVADLKEDDVVSYANSSNKKYDIIVSREVVTASIEEIGGGKYIIDGTEYEIAGNLTAAQVGLNNAKAGDEGDFYINAFGDIAKFEKTKTTASNYGFVVGMGSYTSVGETAYEVKVLAKDGTVATYELATKVTTNANTDGSMNLPADKVVAKDVHDFAKVVFGTVNSEPNLALATTATAANITSYAKRMITYKVNSDGKISTIMFADAAAANSDLKYETATLTAKYSANTKSINNKFITADTVIFNLPMTAGVTADDLTITSKLDADETYKMIALDVDPDTNEIGTMIIAGDNATLGAANNVAVFLKAMAAADDTIKVTFLQGGEEVTLVADNDTTGTASAFTMKKGSIFTYKADADGLIEKADIVLDIDYTNTLANSMTSFMNDTFVPDISALTGADYDFGFVTDKRSGNIVTLEKANAYTVGAGFAGTTTQRLAIPEDATVTVIDLTKALTSATRVVAGHYSDIQATKLTDTDPTAGVAMKVSDEDLDFAAFVKYYKDDIVDVVVIKGAAQLFGLQMDYTTPVLY